MKKFVNLFYRIVSVVLSVTLLIAYCGVSVYAENMTVTEQQGVVSDTLIGLMDHNPNEIYRVIIWLEDIDTDTAVNEALEKIPDYESEMARLCSSPITNEEDDAKWEYFVSTKRNAMKTCYSVYTANFSDKYLTENEVVYNSEYMPIIIAELNSERIEEIALCDGVESVGYYCDDVFIEPAQYNNNYANDIEYYDTDSNMQYINVTNAQQENIFDNTWGTLGYGINIGVLDVGVVDADNIGLNGANIIVHYPSQEPIDDHATKATEIVYNVAPDADFFCTSYNIYADLTINATLITELEWFVANNVDVVNISMGLFYYDVWEQEYYEDEINEYGEIAMILDRYVHQYGFSIVMAAGNYKEDTVDSGAMAYNIITVGNYCRSEDMIVNETSSYNQNNNDDAYKPDICAPGFVDFGNETIASGTSYAAPLVTGVVALMMACRGSLRINPTQAKAILTASVSLDSAHPVPSEDSLYRQYGAGVIDASRANQLIMSGDFISANTQSTPRYYCEYQVELFANQTTRFSLAFEKVMTTDDVSCNLSDLNICVYDTYGRLVCSSQTLNNNIELVEFLPTQYGMYTVRIEQLTIATSSGVSYATPYTFAWLQG